VKVPVDVFVSEDKDKNNPISVVESIPDTIEITPSQSILELVGIDPILKLNSFCKRGCADIYAKIEFMNPSGSIKDRMVAYAVEQAEKRGELKKGDTILEATSGNTGVAVAMVAAAKGYKAKLVIPDCTSEIKKIIMKSYGAELVFTPEKEGVVAVVNKANELAKRRNTWFLNQFENPDNPTAHLDTGREIMKAFGKWGVDAFVAAVGTGGTLIGVARVLKKDNPKTTIFAVEPKKAPAFYNMFYDKSLKIGKGMPHKIEGIGEGFVPKILENNRRFIDGVLLVEDDDSIKTMRELIKKEGVFVGMSSGTNVWAALQVAKELGAGKKVVTVLPDTGQRYLNSSIFKKRGTK
jgi:cysteine synthase A